jgi:DNA-binding GntR family transcriptional regulator
MTGETSVRDLQASGRLFRGTHPTPPRTETLTRHLHAELRSALLDGRVRPGEALVESELMAQHRVSRRVVREALRLLADESLMGRRPRVGTRVRASIRLDALRGTDAEQDDDWIGHGSFVTRASVTDRFGTTSSIEARVVERARVVHGSLESIESTYVRGESALESGPTPAAGRVIVEMVRSDARTAKELGIDPGAPVLSVTETEFPVTSAILRRTTLHHGFGSAVQLGEPAREDDNCRATVTRAKSETRKLSA